MLQTILRKLTGTKDHALPPSSEPPDGWNLHDWLKAHGAHRELKYGPYTKSHMIIDADITLALHAFSLRVYGVTWDSKYADSGHAGFVEMPATLSVLARNMDATQKRGLVDAMIGIRNECEDWHVVCWRLIQMFGDTSYPKYRRAR